MSKLLRERLTMLARALRLTDAVPPARHQLGAPAGRLARCPDRPVCVSSQADRPARFVAPLPGTGGRELSFRRLHTVLNRLPDARIVTATETYLHAEFTSRVFRFRDDVEFVWDEAGQVMHVRSASREGRYDFGVNRSRVERLRGWLSADRVG